MSTNIYSINKPNNFDIEQIFSCGQCFRFNRTEEDPNAFCGVAFSKYIKVTQDSEKVYFHNVTQEEFDKIWSSFLDLSTDYSQIISSFGDDKVLSEAADFSSGIRILKQDKWEALCSFIISQNNNIPRIKGIIENMSAKYGEYIGCYDGKERYAFPTPKSLYEAGIDGLFELKTGFRAKYIYDAASKIVNGEINLDDISKLPLDEAQKLLETIKGVGPKVALCTLLFGFARHEAFPIDVWVKKILEKYYSQSVPQHFYQKNAGIAQQYLFYYERCINNVFI